MSRYLNRALQAFSSRNGRWAFLIALILLAWGLRLVCLEAVPPGWRDDELINIYALSGELFDGHFPLYFTGASGHEPLYHYLHAGVQALLGYNILSGHLLSVTLGTLTIPLAFVLIRRLFGSLVAAVTALGLTTSFWSLMYSRVAIRHISLLPFALAAFYLLWAPFTARSALQAQRRRSDLRWALPLGLVLALSLYTYPAARLLPIILASFALYLGLFHRHLLRRVWVGYGLALGLTVIAALPLAFAITQGSSEAAAQGIGADARLVELARPVWALREGDPGPLLETVWTTLNMFHATGDPEALYNIPNRPVLNLIGAFLFWAGVLVCFFRWRKPRYFFLILWLGLGLLPTVLSVPAASLSHSILIQPLVYLLPALALRDGYRVASRRFAVLEAVPPSLPVSVVAVFVFLLPVAYRDLWDYFQNWPKDSFVRFLYRADYRDVAQYLDTQAETQDWAVASLLMGPWDRLALDVDSRREDITVRLFDPQRALVYAGEGSPDSVLLTSYPSPASPIERLLGEDGRIYPVLSAASLIQYRLEPRAACTQAQPLARFANGLDLRDIVWPDERAAVPGQRTQFVTAWTVSEPLQLPPMPVVANPPPPGVYAGPRLAVFVHILAADGSLITSDDGLWVDPLTLRPGDCFIQVHHFALRPDAPGGPYALEIGLYDPYTGKRWIARGEADLTEADRLVITIP